MRLHDWMVRDNQRPIWKSWAGLIGLSIGALLVLTFIILH